MKTFANSLLPSRLSRCVCCPSLICLKGCKVFFLHFLQQKSAFMLKIVSLFFLTSLKVGVVGLKTYFFLMVLSYHLRSKKRCLGQLKLSNVLLNLSWVLFCTGTEQLGGNDFDFGGVWGFLCTLFHHVVLLDGHHPLPSHLPHRITLVRSQKLKNQSQLEREYSKLS